MRALRVLHLTHPHLVPPDSLKGFTEREINVFKTDWDVVTTLKKLGHHVETLGIEDELQPIRVALRAFKPDIVFNLVEGFAGMGAMDHHVVAFLELLGVPYTGCNPRGLVLARSKALGKKLMAFHRIRAPDFAVFPRGKRARRPRRLEFPLIVKSLTEEASRGISQASVVEDDDHLAERVRFIHESVGSDAIAEQFIPGRELYVGVLGNRQVRVLPTWELEFENMPAGAVAIATEKAKHDVAYQKRRGIVCGPARDLDEAQEREIGRAARRLYRVLELDGYARIDFRLGEDGRLWCLEANPNPEIAEREEFASSAAAAGIDYPALIGKLLSLGLRRRSIARRAD